MPSKQVIDRQKSAEAVIAVGEIHAAAVAPALAAELQPHLGEGETLPDLGLLMRLMARMLQATRTDLVTADEAHEAELADDIPARQDRDTRAQTLFSRMVELREVLQGLYGADLVRAVMPAPTPSDPVVLSRFAGEVLTALAAAQLPPPRIPGATLDIPALVAELQTHRDALAQQLTAVALEVREAQATQVARNRAMDTHDQIFAAVATTLSGMLQLAGEHELAARVRPPRRRPGRPASGTDPVLEAPEAPESPASESAA